MKEHSTRWLAVFKFQGHKSQGKAKELNCSHRQELKRGGQRARTKEDVRIQVTFSGARRLEGSKYVSVEVLIRALTQNPLYRKHTLRCSRVVGMVGMI